MSNIRLPKSLCVVVAEVLQIPSHAAGNLLFRTAGAPEPPSPGPHTTKWKDWLFRAGQDPNVDSLSVLGNVLEEFMDIGPKEGPGAFHFAEEFAKWKADRERVVQVLEENGFRYYRGGRVLPTGQTPEEVQTFAVDQRGPTKPAKIDDLLETLLKGLRRAMHPLTHRRKGAQSLSFSTEYDVQDLLHAFLRPWVFDIRPEEFTPSYAGSSTRMDFLLPKYKIVLELKFVRDRNHAKEIGKELIQDIDHYQRHPDCQYLWCVVFDQYHLLPNKEGLTTDLEGPRTTKTGTVQVRVCVLKASLTYLMNSTTQILLSILTILSSGVVSSIVTYRLNLDKAKREFKREKLETLLQAIPSYSRTIQMATASWPLVISGLVNANAVLQEQNKIYSNSPNDIDRCILLVDLYFRTLKADLEMFNKAASELNSFTEHLTKIDQLPTQKQHLSKEFYQHLNRFLEKEAAIKQRISEIALKL